MDNNSQGHYIPIAGECPLCECKVTWTELLQRQRKLQNIGCDSEESEEEEEDFEDEFDEDAIASADEINDEDIYVLSD